MKLLELDIPMKKYAEIQETAQTPNLIEPTPGTPVPIQMVNQSELMLVKNINEKIASLNEDLSLQEKNLNVARTVIIEKLAAGCKVEPGTYKAKIDKVTVQKGKVNWKDLAKKFTPQAEIDKAMVQAKNKKEDVMQLLLFD